MESLGESPSSRSSAQIRLDFLDRCYSRAVAEIERISQEKANLLNPGSITNTDSMTEHYALGRSIVHRALPAIITSTYSHAGNGPQEYDCSGLVHYAVTNNRLRLHTTWDYVSNRSVFPWTIIPRPGDIIANHFANEGHCGIYYGACRMIHAASREIGIIDGYFNPLHEDTKYRICRYVGDVD